MSKHDKDALQEPVIAKTTVTDTCPECGLPAALIASPVIEQRIFVSTFRCPNGHQFSKKVDLK